MNDEKKRKKLYIKLRYLADDAMLDREDRLELARYIFRNEGYEYLTSFSELKTKDLEILEAVLSGYRTIQELRLCNGSLEVQARVVLEKLSETASETAQRQNETGEWT